MAKLSNNWWQSSPLPCAVLLNDFITRNRLTSKDSSSWSLEPANMTLFGKRVFSGVMKLRVLRRDGPGLSRWALSAITRWESGRTHTEEETTWRRSRRVEDAVSALKVGVMWPQPRTLCSPRKREVQSSGLPRASEVGPPCQHLNLDPGIRMTGFCKSLLL